MSHPAPHMVSHNTTESSDEWRHGNMIDRARAMQRIQLDVVRDKLATIAPTDNDDTTPDTTQTRDPNNTSEVDQPHRPHTEQKDDHDNNSELEADPMEEWIQATLPDEEIDAEERNMNGEQAQHTSAEQEIS